MKVSNIDSEIILINRIAELITGYSNSLHELLTDKRSREITFEFREGRSRRVDPRFNIFAIISDTYYRENFHSDIIAFFLNRESNHNRDNGYLKTFIELLQLHNHDIKIDDFTNSIVTREEGRIDIWIRDETSKMAIIIENKINDALDMEKQIPRYDSYVASRGYKVVAVVYLSSTGNKAPNDSGWSDNERSEISKKLIKLAAYNESEKDLFNGWLKPSIFLTSDSDVKGILGQYRELIQTLNGHKMNNQVLEKFYNHICGTSNRENYDTAVSIKDMLNELPKYLAFRLQERHEQNLTPFKKVWIYKDTCTVVQDWIINNYNFKIDVVCYYDRYELKFCEEKYSGSRIDDPTLKIIESMGLKNDFGMDNDKLVKKFKFPSEEEALYEFMDSFKSKARIVDQNIFDH